MMRVEYDILGGTVVRCLRVWESLARAIVGDEMGVGAGAGQVGLAGEGASLACSAVRTVNGRA
jgi:hypothetical protein